MKLHAVDRAHAVRIADWYNWLPEDLYYNIIERYPNAKDIFYEREDYYDI